MPRYRIRITNREFESCSDANATDHDGVRSEALKSALQIGIDDVCNGKAFFGAEVAIENEHEPIERLVVAIGMSPLL